MNFLLSGFAAGPVADAESRNACGDNTSRVPLPSVSTSSGHEETDLESPNTSSGSESRVPLPSVSASPGHEEVHDESSCSYGNGDLNPIPQAKAGGSQVVQLDSGSRVTGKLNLALPSASVSQGTRPQPGSSSRVMTPLSTTGVSQGATTGELSFCVLITALHYLMILL